jgi:hypothetical protein
MEFNTIFLQINISACMILSVILYAYLLVIFLLLLTQGFFDMMQFIEETMSWAGAATLCS